MSIGVAMHTRCTPAAVDDMPVVDAISFINKVNEKEESDARFQAALHGRELQ